MALVKEPVRSPRPGKVGRAVRARLRGVQLDAGQLLAAALAEATADLADQAWRQGRSREFSLLLKDLRPLLESCCGDGAGADDAGSPGRVEPEPVQPRGLAAVLGAGAPMGDDQEC